MASEAKIAELKEELKELAGKFEEAGVTMSYEEKVEFGSVDETKGIVSDEVVTESNINSGLVLEQSESGKGFSLYRDYSRDKSGKLRRLIRE